MQPELTLPLPRRGRLNNLILLCQLTLDVLPRDSAGLSARNKWLMIENTLQK